MAHQDNIHIENCDLDEYFHKREGTTDHGRDYENFMVANLSLKMVLNEKVLDYKISANDSRFADFDDVVLDISLKSGIQEKIAIQLKHTTNKKKLNSTAPEPFPEQAEKTNQVNYFATLRTCEILFPILRQNGRVVNVSSSEGHLSKIPSAELRAKLIDPALTVPALSKLIEQFIEDAKSNKHKATWGNSSYAVSKVALSALTRVQQREFDKENPNRNISVNAVHPGYVDTDMTSHTGPWTIEQGAAAPLWLALEAPSDVKGQYVWKDATIAQWDAERPPARF